MTAVLTRDTEQKPGTMTLKLRQIRSGDHAVTRDVFEVWFQRLSKLGTQLLPSGQRGVMDGEDLAQSVLASFFASLEAGFLDKSGRPIPIHSRHDVWRMLARRLRLRASNARRDLNSDRRGGGRIVAAGNPQIGNRMLAVPDPAFDNLAERIAILHEEMVNCFTRAGLKQIAELLLHGVRPDDIAAELQLSPATVYRKLRLIEQHWADAAAEISADP
jgi:DNA-directed RNA polymerase specialized sigma24 family protein